MKKIIYILCGISILLSGSVLRISCGDSGSTGDRSSTGNVALYVTDDITADYKHVEVTINGVQLLHTGTDTVCEFYNPEDLDITDLSSTIQFLDVNNCRTGNYNRIHIEFSQDVMLTNQLDEDVPCRFTSHKDQHDNPNILQCIEKENETNCFMDMNGNVKVVQNKTEDVVLDFDLKKFEVVNDDISGCSVTIKVSPLNKSDVDKKHENGYKKAISGYVTAVGSEKKEFTLTTGSGDLIVSYADVEKEDIENLLNLAKSDNLEVIVKSMSIDFNQGPVIASGIYLKMEGTVSKLDIIKSIFSLLYQPNKTIIVDYKNAEVEGNLEKDAFVKVKLNDYNGEHYIAEEVEVEEAEEAGDDV
ncbi:MAG: DUF4382 domain-containing protein [Nitrospiraceae bacterium]|nr:MAG: DUF4382 domain-containing protein [Nitrospiraceae bacterium]